MARRARNIDGGLSETAWQAQVVGLASFYGWRHYHTVDSRRSVAGFPDLVLVRGHELLFVELKTDKGTFRPGQQEWLDALGEVGAAVVQVVELIRHELDLGIAVEAHCWRPADFDEVQARLARGRVLQPSVNR